MLYFLCRDFLQINMKKYLGNNSGQTLLEALIALSLIVIILGAVSISVLTSLNSSSFIKQQNQANKLAQQGLEYIRDQISNNNQYPIYSTYNTGSRCLDSLNTLGSSPCNPLTPTDMIYGTFKREVSFSAGNCGLGGTIQNGVQVTVNVSWNSSKCTTSFCNVQGVKSCYLDPSKAFPTTIPTTYQGI